MSGNLTLTADSAGSSYAQDPELRLPERPRFPPEVLMLPFGQSGLLFEGANGTQVLNGRGARGFIPGLLPHLDGRTTLAALAAKLPTMPEKNIRDAVALLYSRGLLEDGDEGDVPAGLEDVAAFAGRYADVTRVNRNRGEVLTRLARARVAIVGPADGVASMQSALADQGLAALTIATDAAQLTADTDLVVMMFAGDAPEAAAWMESARTLGLRVLHAHLGRDIVEVGPLFMPGKSGCYGCLRQVRPAPTGAPRAQDVGYWGGVLALHAFHILSRLGRPFLYNTCHVHRRLPNGHLYEEKKLARLPGCAACGLRDCRPLLHEENGAVWLLHNAANGMPPRELRCPRDYQLHYAPGNLRVTKEIPEPFHGAVGLPLTRRRGLTAAPSWLRPALPRREPTCEDVATILQMTVGYQATPEGVRRVLPCGGGLGSAQAFVIARGVAGLEDGVYHYYAHANRLDRLREANLSVVAGALGITERELRPLTLVGVGHLSKLRHKYGNFAFRFAHLDAGVVRINLCEVLDGLGLDHVAYPEVRDKVIAQAVSMPTVGGRNVVTHAIGIGAPRGRTGLGMVEQHQYVDALIDLASRRQAPVAGVPKRAAPQAGAGWPEAKRTTLEQVLLERRSSRSLGTHALPAATLHAIATLAADANDWLERCGGVPMDMTLWALRTLGDDAMPAGIYRWDAESARLVSHRAGLRAEELDAAMPQRNLARAPLVFFITGNFQSAVLAHGARGYAEMIARSGAMAARAVLAATTYGFDGCLNGGLCEDAWGDLLGIDRYTQCPLFSVSLGQAHAG
jgi:SagB-type dehydrogenase family enzyme